MTEDTPAKILAAARKRLLAEGYAALTTRGVAETAGVPLSQIHYHFGSREELILRMLRADNERLLDRQTEMFSQDLPLWKRWEQACDYFDDDIESGYVRVLMEMTAAGWSSEPIRKEVKAIYGDWAALLGDVAAEADANGAGLGGMTPVDIAALVAAVFVGAEALILSDLESDLTPFRGALRNLGQLIRQAEGATP